MLFIFNLPGVLRFLLPVGFSIAAAHDAQAAWRGISGHADLALYEGMIALLLLVGPRRFWLFLRRKRRHGAGAAVLATLCVLTASVTAHADQPAALHTTPWYMQHPAEREATLEWCHVDAGRTRMFDCQNAEAAGNARIFTRPQPRDFLKDPSWWRANPMVRDGVLRTCAAPTEADGPYLRYCRYAAMGL